MQVSERINDKHKEANFIIDGVRKTEFSSFEGREDDENNGVGFVEISKICVTLDTFSVGLHQLTDYIVTFIRHPVLVPEPC